MLKGMFAGLFCLACLFSVTHYIEPFRRLLGWVHLDAVLPGVRSLPDGEWLEACMGELLSTPTTHREVLA